MNRVRDIALQTINSLWFIPGLLILALALAAVGAVSVDLWLDGRTAGSLSDRLPWVFSASPPGARAMLGTIAGALITAAGVTFSGVSVALSIASSQYTSRILSSFTADRLNQFTVGLIIGAFVYCLLVLRTIGVRADTFVPELAVALAVMLGVFATCTLVVFVHGVTKAIQASEILLRITQETTHSIEATFPEAPAKDPTEQGNSPQGGADEVQPMAGREPDRAASFPSLADSGWISVRSKRAGYLRTVDLEILVEAACRFNVVVRMEQQTGSFVHEGSGLVSILPAGGLEDDELNDLRGLLWDAHTIGSFRTVEQDPAYGVRQLVDIALRALSPGINDTTTSVMAVQRITQVLLVALRREAPSHFRYKDGLLRVCVLRHDVTTLAMLGYEQIRHFSRGNAAATEALLQGWIELLRAPHGGPLAELILEWVDRILSNEDNERFFRTGEWPRIESDAARIRALARP